MSLRENPVILRQGFNKLWQNNICLSEESNSGLQFISLYHMNLALWGLLEHRYTKIVSNRIHTTDNYLDAYVNVYKYRKNRLRRKRRKKRWQQEFLFIARKSKYKLERRFEKTTLIQQLLQEFADISVNMLGLLFRLREPARRLRFMSKSIIPWFRKRLHRVRKQKHFINTVHQVIFLHYYKVSTLFSNHFGRELERVRKKVHWKLISSFKGLLQAVPIHRRIRRQFYGLLIEINGRPKGRNRTVTYRMQEGSFAPQSYRERVNLGYGEAIAKVGVMGIKTRVAY